MLTNRRITKVLNLLSDSRLFVIHYRVVISKSNWNARNGTFSIYYRTYWIFRQ